MPPSYPQQPYGQPPMPSSVLKFTVQGNLFTSSLVPPTLTIDGHLAPTSVASFTTIPIQPGLHRLEVFSQWLRRYGQAALDVQVPPNSTVEVFYAPPWHQFTTGTIGFSPQKRNGLGCLLIPLAVILLTAVLSILLAVLTS